MPDAIVAISYVSREADVIEAFVRHHCALVDRMMIVARYPNHQTTRTLQDLRKEGLPIDVIIDDDPAVFRQSEALTALLRKIGAERSASWILPLDPDEFLVAVPGMNVRSVLESASRDRVLLAPWRTYVPTTEDPTGENNILRRVVYRRAVEQPQFCKTCIPVERITPQSHLPIGNHELVDGLTGAAVPALRSATLHIAHFPVRSSDQIIEKVLCGALDIKMMPAPAPTTAFHWQELWERCARGASLTSGELTDLALGYTATPSGSGTIPGIIREPVPVGFSLRYSQETEAPIGSLARSAMTLAEEASALRTQPSADLPAELGLKHCVEVLRRHLTELAAQIPFLPGADFLPAPPRHAAVVLICSCIAAHRRMPLQTSMSSLAQRMTLAQSMPLLPSAWAAFRFALAEPKLPMTVEHALRSLLSTVARISQETLTQEARMKWGTDDWWAVLTALLLEEEDVPRLGVNIPSVSAAATNMVHTALTEQFDLPQGIASEDVSMVDPCAGIGGMVKEYLRRAITARFRDGANPVELARSLRTRAHAHTETELHAACLHLQCNELLRAYDLPFDDGQTFQTSNGHLSSGFFDRSAERSSEIAVLCTALPEVGSTGNFLTGTKEQTAVLAEYMRQSRRHGTDSGLFHSDFLQALAAAHALLVGAERSVGAIVAPRRFLESALFTDARRHLLESFEQIQVLDLHGEATFPDEGTDEPWPSSPRSGLCVLLLLRGRSVAQQTRYASLQGLRVQKMHMLLSRSVSDLPWQRIAPDRPSYLFLPRFR